MVFTPGGEAPIFVGRGLGYRQERTISNIDPDDLDMLK
jgi:hypothetical protein